MSDKKHRFGGLYSLLNTRDLRVAYYEINPKAAVGIDETDHTEFGKDLETHVTGLASEFKEKRYHAELIRRKHIPKALVEENLKKTEIVDVFW